MRKEEAPSTRDQKPNKSGLQRRRHPSPLTGKNRQHKSVRGKGEKKIYAQPKSVTAAANKAAHSEGQTKPKQFYKNTAHH
jgi:hypothetical protein